MPPVFKPLDATLNVGVPISRGVNWLVGLITPAELDPTAITAIAATTEAAIGLPLVLRPGWMTGRDSAISTQTLTGLYQVPLLSPFECGGPVTIDDIGIGITGAGTGVIRLGILSLNSTGTPVTFLGGGSGVGDAGAHDFGSVSATGTGEKNVGTAQFGTPLVLTAGRYMVCACWQSDSGAPPTIRSYVSDEHATNHVGSAPPGTPIAGRQGSSTVSGGFSSPFGGTVSAALAFGPRVIPHVASSP